MLFNYTLLFNILIYKIYKKNKNLYIFHHKSTYIIKIK